MPRTGGLARAPSRYEESIARPVRHHRRGAARPTGGWPGPCAGRGGPGSWCTSGVDLRMRLWQRAEDEAVACLRRQPAGPAAGRPGRRAPDDGPGSGLPHRGQGRGGGRHRQGGRDRHDLPARAARGRWDESIAILARLAAAHGVELIAIGNGTASRETDRLAADLIRTHPELKLTKVVVSEAGASVYSASAYASRELPGMDVSLRGAVSIARRLQDPLAELVKIDPKSIGVGQYQHDVSEIQAVPLARRRGGGRRQRGRGRRQHRVGRRCWPGCPGSASGLADGIVAHRDDRRAVPQPPRADRGAAARPEGLRAVRRIPAHPRRRRPAGRLQRAPGGLSGGPAHPGRGRDAACPA